MSTTHPVLLSFETTIHRQTLTYAVSHAIFCPMCGNILDKRRALLLKTPAVPTCLKCWEKYERKAAAIGPDAVAAVAALVDLDGRVLFAKQPRSRAALYHVVNVITGEKRRIKLTPEAAEECLVNGDVCAGPCACTIEPDTTCRQGWPAMGNVIAGG